MLSNFFVSLGGSMLGAVAQGVLWGIMALGVFITFKILNFADMTVDGSFATGGCVCALLIVHGCDPLFAVLVAAVLGTLAGLITGLLHTKLKIPGILSGILMQLALYSINLRILGGKANQPLSPVPRNKVFTGADWINNWKAFFGHGAVNADGSVVEPINISIMDFFNKWFNLKQAFKDNATSFASLLVGLVICGIIIFALYWFFGTEIGSAIRATGNNENMSRAQGINTDKTKIIALMLSNALVAVSGALVMQQQRFGDVGMGIGTIVIGLASIIIGEVIFGHRFGFWWDLLAVVFGSVIYRVIIAVVLKLGMKTNDLKLLSAVVVAIALSVPVIKKKLISRRKKNA